MDGTEDRSARLNLSLTTNDQLRFRLYGKTIGHPTNPDGRYVYVSAPVEFNELTHTLRTASGREYQLAKCGGADEAEHLEYVRKDILRNKRLPPSQIKPVVKPVVSEDPEATVINLDLGTEVDQAFGRGQH